jgi:flagellar motor switch protein FliN/FliY
MNEVTTTSSPDGSPIGAPGAAGSAPAVEQVFPVPTPSVEATQQSSFRAMESLGFVMDIPVELTVEIGRRRMRIGEILKLGPGSILELTKAAGESLDIYANNRLVARGEAVAIGERYGVRLSEVVVTVDAYKSNEGES